MQIFCVKNFIIFVKIFLMQLFYNPNLTPENQFFTFDKEESKHIIRVLRKDIGNVLMVTNGNGYLFTSKITEATEKKCVVSIVNHELQPKPQNNLHIAIAPTKMNDRIEWFLEKATEIGVSEITFLHCKRSERAFINRERFEKIVIAAAKQSLQFYFPKINDFEKFDVFIKNNLDKNKCIAHCEEKQKISFKDTLNTIENTTILIGPEGDFTPQEIELAFSNNFKPVTLGKNRLRTETAGVMAAAMFAMES
jgi:16S rRNA (uracil1498-N3)-methyltransferase